MTQLNAELQKFIFTTLNSDSGLGALGVVGVYDKVPDSTEYPYIRIEGISTNNNDSHTDTGFLGDVTIKVFDRNDSSLRTKKIQSRVYELLNNWNIAMDNFKVINFRCTLTNDLVENDNRTHNGTQIFSFIIARLNS